MNAAGSAVAWCAVQVALVGVAAISAYWLVVKLHQAAGGFAATTGLAMVFCLSAAAASPWPRWSFLDHRPTERNQNQSRSRGNRIPFSGKARSASTGTPLPLASPLTAAAPGRGMAPSVAWSEAPSPPRFSHKLLNHARGALGKNVPARPSEWRWTSSLCVLFTLGLALAAARLTVALVAVAALRRRTWPITDPSLLTLWNTLRTRYGAVRPAELREAPTPCAPATVGWLRPVILLPPDWRAWSDDERRAVLAHELAHVERGDYLLWLAAQMALVLHFYHPAVHWLAAKIRLEQEFAADAAAVALLGSKRVYLAALARLALRGAAPPFGAAPSFVSSRGMLLQRIDRLRSLEPQPSSTGRFASKVVALAILLTAGMVAVGLRGGATTSFSTQSRLESPPAAILSDGRSDDRYGP